MNVEKSLGNQSPPKHVIQCENTAILPKMCSPELGKKSIKKKERKKERKKEPIFERYISPLCPVDPAGPIFTIFGT